MVKAPPDRIEIVKRLQGLLLPNETWSVSKQILGQHQHPYTPHQPSCYWKHQRDISNTIKKASTLSSSQDSFDTFEAFVNENKM